MWRVSTIAIDIKAATVIYWPYTDIHINHERKWSISLTSLETHTLILKTDDRDENLFMSDGWGLVVMVKSSWSAGSEEWDWLSGAQTKHRLESWSARLSLMLWTSRSWMAIRGMKERKKQCSVNSNKWMILFGCKCWRGNKTTGHWSALLFV